MHVDRVMYRREFITLLGGAAWHSLASNAPTGPSRSICLARGRGSLSSPATLAVLSVVAGFATEQAAVDSALRLEAIEISALAQTVAPRATLTSDRPHSAAIDN
jgi:hypothetical protein